MSQPQPAASTARCAVIAGKGRFPLLVTQEAKRQGLQVIVMGLKGWADPELARHANVYEEVQVGHLGRLIERLKFHGVRQAVMAGQVTKAVLDDTGVVFDALTLAILATVKDRSVPGLLGAVAERLAKDGITLLDSSSFLTANLCPAGPLTRRRPTAEETRDIAVGAEAARRIASLDVGQTVLVKDGVVIAVEAVEGTNAAIRRAHAMRGPGFVVVKMAAPAHDRRFDLPVIGLDTIDTVVETGGRCVAMEQGVVLILDKDAVIQAADTAKLCLIGIEPPAAP